MKNSKKDEFYTEDEFDLDESIQMSEEAKNRIYNNIMQLIETRKSRKIIQRKVMKYSFATLFIICVLSLSIYSYKNPYYLNNFYNHSFNNNIYNVSYHLENDDVDFNINEILQLPTQVVLYASSNSKKDISQSFIVNDSNNQELSLYVKGYNHLKEKNNFLLIIDKFSNVDHIKIGLNEIEDVLEINLKDVHFVKSTIDEIINMGNYDITSMHIFDSQILLYIMPSDKSLNYNTLDEEQELNALLKYVNDNKLSVIFKKNDLSLSNEWNRLYNNYDGSYLVVYYLNSKIDINDISVIYFGDTQIK